LKEYNYAAIQSSINIYAGMRYHIHQPHRTYLSHTRAVSP